MTLTLNQEIDMRIWAKTIRNELYFKKKYNKLNAIEDKSLNWFIKYCAEIEL